MATATAVVSQPVRDARSVTAGAEKRLLVWMAQRLPPWVSPDHLTALGSLGFVLGAVCYWLSAGEPLFLLGVNLGLLLNWFGDSLDGTLARVRNRQRPRYGFYVDHLLDAVGIAVLLGGLALSGFVSPLLAGGLLVAYLLFSVHIALAAASGGVFQIAYGGVGGTELRVMLALVNLALLQWPRLEVLGFSFLLLDSLALLGTVGILAMLAAVGYRTGHALDVADRALLPPDGRAA
jgi:phosphatidylglycerophosphate synthase